MPVFPYNAGFSFFFCLSPPSHSENITVSYLPVFTSVAKKIPGYKNIGGALAPPLAPPPFTPMCAAAISRNKVLCVYFHLLKRCIILSLRNEILILTPSVPVFFFFQNHIILCACRRACFYIYIYIYKFSHHSKGPTWETLASRRKIARLCALYKAFGGERAWKAIGDRLERPHYLSRADHNHKIRNKRQKTDIGKYSFVNRTIEHWNQLPAEVLDPLPCNLTIFRKRIRKVISMVR